MSESLCLIQPHIIDSRTSRCVNCGVIKAAFIMTDAKYVELDSKAGIKHDEGKPRMDLIPADVLLKVAEVLTHGAREYGERNWEKGMRHGRLLGATLRHIAAYMMGEDVDKDSKLHPIDHAITDLMMLRGLILRNKGNDTRS